MRRLDISLCAVFAVAIGMSGGSAWGVNFSWNRTTSSTFNTAGNWTPSGGPPNDSNDFAIFNQLAAYTVVFSSNVTNSGFSVGAGTVTFDLHSLTTLFDYTLATQFGNAAVISSSSGSSLAAKLILDGFNTGSDRPRVITTGSSYVGFGNTQKGILELHDTFWNGGAGMYVGFRGQGGLDLDEDSTISGGVGSLGHFATGNGTANIEGFWQPTSMTVGYLGSGTLNIEGIAIVATGNMNIAGEPGSTGVVNVNLSTQNQGGLLTDFIHVGGGNNGDLANDDDGGTGTLNINGGTVYSGDAIIGSADPGSGVAAATLKQMPGAAGSTIWNIDVSLGGSGELHVRGANGATLSIQARTKVLSSQAYIANLVGTSADVEVTGASALWQHTFGFLGGDENGPGGTGTLQINNNGTVDASVLLKVWDNFAVTVDGGTIKTETLDVAGTLTQVGSPLVVGTNQDIESFVLSGGTVTAPVIEILDKPLQGRGTLAGDVIAHKGVTATGNLTLGDASSFSGVQILSGVLDVGSHAVTLHHKGFVHVGTTVIAGGTLVVPNGLALGVGDNLIGGSAVAGKIAAGIGSTIEATGNLFIGSVSAFDGFFSDGSLVVGDHIVTLLDANEAVLGSLTTLGNAASAGNPGTLTAANGFLLEQGKNVTGYGMINGDFINQGYVEGVGPDAGDAIEFTGDVSGIGSYAGNIIFSGGFSPGNSPGEVGVDGNMILGESARLEMELGGLIAGSQHDRVVVAGDFIADGELDIVLINGFVPQAGDAFDLFAFAGAAGAFDRIGLPTLNNGLQFNTSSLLTTGRLFVVVPEPGAVWLVAAVGAGVLRRRREDRGGAH